MCCLHAKPCVDVADCGTNAVLGCNVAACPCGSFIDIDLFSCVRSSIRNAESEEGQKTQYTAVGE